MRAIAYLDSSYLIGIVSDKPSEQSKVKDLLSKISKRCEIVVPQVVIGEVVSVITKNIDNTSKAYEKMQKFLNELYMILKPTSCLPPLEKEALCYAHVLSNRDSNLDITDLLIISQALQDRDSKYLFTSDSKLLRSKTIKEFECEIRKEGKRNKILKIKEYV